MQQQQPYNQAYGRGGYPQGYAAPQPQFNQQYAAYQQGPYYQQYPGNFMYQSSPQNFQGYDMDGNGRGGFQGGMRGGRGGGRGGAMGAPLRRKKPFVGGSLETQREWERKTACCFFQQGNCKFGENCRFLHDEIKEGLSCQFGENCRFHGKKDAEEGAENHEAEHPAEAEAAAAKPAEGEKPKEDSPKTEEAPQKEEAKKE